MPLSGLLVITLSAAFAGPAGSLAAYAGRYPGDPVNGVAFIDDRLVSGAVARAVGDTAIVTRILSHDSTQMPIARRGTRLVSAACEPHNCGPHFWSILIEMDGSTAEICYHDAEAMGERSRWYRAGRAPEMRDGDCPSE